MNCIPVTKTKRTLISSLLWVVAFACLCAVLVPSTASAETRSLKLYFLHTGERAEITFKRNGKYVKGGLKKINRFLRDWRRNEPTKMDPRLLDLIWEVYKETGSRKPIHIISAYRSPSTNKLLRKRGRGVARKSQHTLGKAMDFFIPGVPLRKLRNIGLKKGLGGVGYYPKSGSPFVHMDTGRVRHWPRMSRKELVRVFPKGKTLHVPTDGKPLARYNRAKAEYDRKITGRGKIVVAKAEEIEKKPGFFSRMLGRDDEEDGNSLAPVAAPKPVQVSPQPKPAEVVLPNEPAAPTPAEPEAVPQTPETILASLPSSALPVPRLAPRVVDQGVALTPQEPELPEAQTEGDALATKDELPQEEATIEIASIIPTRRPVAEPAVDTALENEPVLADTQTAPVSEPVQTAALSPTEIEDLRQQVYSTLSAPIAKNTQSSGPVPAAPIPAAPVGQTENVQIAQARLGPATTPVSNSASNVLSINQTVTNDPTAGSSAIENQLIPDETPSVISPIVKPVEETIQETQIAAVSFVPERSPIKQQIAEKLKEEALDAEAALEEPVQTSEGTQVTGIPVPLAATRASDSTPKIDDAETAPLLAETKTEPSVQRIAKLEQLEPTSIKDRMVGKWALAADTSISRIADINPPAYGRNAIRELPQTVLSRGFSRERIRTFTQGFSGSSIEFLDFRRFN